MYLSLSGIGTVTSFQSVVTASPPLMPTWKSSVEVSLPRPIVSTVAAFEARTEKRSASYSLRSSAAGDTIAPPVYPSPGTTTLIDVAPSAASSVVIETSLVAPPKVANSEFTYSSSKTARSFGSRPESTPMSSAPASSPASSPVSSTPVSSGPVSSTPASTPVSSSPPPPVSSPPPPPVSCASCGGSRSVRLQPTVVVSVAQSAKTSVRVFMEVSFAGVGGHASWVLLGARVHTLSEIEVWVNAVGGWARSGERGAGADVVGAFGRMVVHVQCGGLTLSCRWAATG